LICSRKLTELLGNDIQPILRHPLLLSTCQYAVQSEESIAQTLMDHDLFLECKNDILKEILRPRNVRIDEQAALLKCEDLESVVSETIQTLTPQWEEALRRRSNLVHLSILSVVPSDFSKLAELLSNSFRGIQILEIGYSNVQFDVDDILRFCKVVSQSNTLATLTFDCLFTEPALRLLFESLAQSQSIRILGILELESIPYDSLFVELLECLVDTQTIRILRLPKCLELSPEVTERITSMFIDNTSLVFIDAKNSHQFDDYFNNLGFFGTRLLGRMNNNFSLQFNSAFSYENSQIYSR
jgi:hypothetical protein